MSVTGSEAQRRKAGRAGRFGLGCFFSIFLLIGIGVSIPFLVIPLMNAAGSGGWIKTPCTILESRVDESSSKGSSTYAVKVRYSYAFRGKTHESERYGFLMNVYSSGRSGKEAVVARLKPGTQTICHVNPKDPGFAVLEKDLGPEYLIGLVPLVFVLVGGLGLFFTIRSAFRTKPTPLAPVLPLADASPSATVRALSPGKGRFVKFLVLLVITLFWNGITSVFAFQAYFGSGDGCLKVFVLPFLAVGAGLLIGSVYTFLQLFNPRPVLTISPGEVGLGETVEVAWETSGNLHKIQKWSIELEAYEEVRYRQGTRTTTEKSIFLTLIAHESTQGEDLRRGRAEVKIPAASMHSFEAPNNKIHWLFRVKAEIPNWPDIADEFPFKVRPQRVDGDLGLAPPAAEPPMSCDHSATDRNWMVRLKRKPAAYFPGESVDGEVIWNFPAGAQRLNLRLYHRTEGKGTQDVIVVAEQHVERPTGHVHHPFSFKLPAGPYSFSGKLVSLTWGIEVVEEPGGDARGEGFILSPSGEEVRLPS